MDIPRQSRSLFLIGLGGVLVGVVLGWLVWGNAPSAGVAYPRDDGRRKIAVTADALGASPARADSALGVESVAGADGGTVDFVAEMRGALREVGEWDRLRRLHATIDQLEPADLEVAASQVRLLPSGERDLVGSILGERWAAFAPAAALAASKKLDDDDGGMVRGIFRKWSVAAPDEARAWVEAQPPGKERTGFARALVAAVARGNPAAAVEMAARLNILEEENYQIREIFGAWAAENPTAAASSALALLKGPNRREALSFIAGSWAEQDPAAAYAWAKSVGEDAGTRRKLIEPTLDAWLKSDPAAAQAQILALPPGGERTAALRSAIKHLHGADELSSALALLAELPAGRARSSAVEDFIGDSEAASDPQFAQRLYEMIPVGNRPDIVWNLARRMAEKDVPAAFQWATALPEGPVRQQALLSIGYEWAKKDPRPAFAWLLKNDPPIGGDGSFQNQFSEWSEAAPNDALQWARALPAGVVRDILSASAVVGFAQSDPQRALALVPELSPGAQARAASDLAATWMNNDPDAAAVWVAQLPAGKARQEAMSYVADRWAQSDPDAVAAWLNRLPAGVERDAVIGSFVFRAADADPEGALAWAASITDQTRRAEQIESLAQGWLRNDPAAARRWLAKTNQLTPERKAQLLQRKSAE